MIEDTPPPPKIVKDTTDKSAVNYTSCSSEVTLVRGPICRHCEKMIMNNKGITICSESGLDINLMISVNETTCPLGKW